MPIVNGSFETAGAAPGLAQGWVSTYVSSLEQWADFTQNPSEVFLRAQEAFEAGWTVVDQVLLPRFVGETIDLGSAVFNIGAGQAPLETFERAWNEPSAVFLPVLGTEEPAQFSGQDSDSFDVGWGDVSLLMGATTAATFDGGLILLDNEGFEGGWGAFSDDVVDFVMEAALFDFGTAERFEQVIAAALFTAALSDTLALSSAPALALANGQAVTLLNNGGQLPAPLGAATTYFLSAVSGLSFQLLNHVGGTPINITDEGTGQQYLLRDPSLWWSRMMTTV